MMKTRLQCSQLDLARFQWLSEDALTCAGRNSSQMAMPTRATVMAELRNVRSLLCYIYRGYLYSHIYYCNGGLNVDVNI